MNSGGFVLMMMMVRVDEEQRLKFVSCVCMLDLPCFGSVSHVSCGRRWCVCVVCGFFWFCVSSVGLFFQSFLSL